MGAISIKVNDIVQIVFACWNAYMLKTPGKCIWNKKRTEFLVYHSNGLSQFVIYVAWTNFLLKNLEHLRSINWSVKSIVPLSSYYTYSRYTEVKLPRPICIYQQLSAHSIQKSHHYLLGLFISVLDSVLYLPIHHEYWGFETAASWTTSIQQAKE